MSNSRATPPARIAHPGPAAIHRSADAGSAVPLQHGGSRQAGLDDPSAAYTEMAAEYECGTPDLDEVMPPFVVGLLSVAGRLLAVLAYQDALLLADQPLNRRSSKNKATVFVHLSSECDRQDTAWRLRWHGVSMISPEDLEAGRAPVPRCTGEQWALRMMAEHAPCLLARSDAELADLDVPVVDHDEHYRSPYWEGMVEDFLLDGAEDTIPPAVQPNDVCEFHSVAARHQAITTATDPRDRTVESLGTP